MDRISSRWIGRRPVWESRPTVPLFGQCCEIYGWDGSGAQERSRGIMEPGLGRGGREK